jgi:NAD-dependent DNA ligase
MIKIQETQEFKDLQKELLRHKKLYYVEDRPVISDYDYDMLEKKSMEMAQELGFRADRWEDPEENEAHHVHWMVGYKESSVYNN